MGETQPKYHNDQRKYSSNSPTSQKPSVLCYPLSHH